MLGMLVFVGRLGIEFIVFFRLLGMLVIQFFGWLASQLLLVLGLQLLQRRMLGLFVIEFFRRLGFQQQLIQQRHRDLR
jgi:hypothetical protein